ncbi:MAG: outer membrane lipoprotein-sorting protein [Planctomycetaceae bacterium]|jgi:hypothetical protein|nr:outer membrane lipoprotein-sorting protein [Planctomycetaceae bacterium]
MNNRFVFVVVVVIICFSSKVVANNALRLENICNSIKSNSEGIFSWKGKVVVKTTMTDSNPSTPMPHEQYTEYVYHFTVDRGHDAFFSSAELKNEYSVFGKNKVSLLLSNQNYMYFKGTFFSFEWQKREQEGMIYDGNKLVNVQGNDYNRVAVIHVTKPKTKKLMYFFDPFLKYFCGDDRIFVDLENIIVGIKRHGITNFDLFSRSATNEKIQLTQENDCFRLEFTVQKAERQSSQVYIFDTKQGGNIISYSLLQKTGDKIIDSKNYKCDYQKVNGYWIPKKTVMQRRLDSNSRCFTEIIDWVSNEINVIIPDNFFSLQRLGIHRGDTVYDERTQESTIINSDDFPSLPQQLKSEIRRISYSRLFIIFCGIILIVVSIFMKWRQWSKSKTKREQTNE